MPTYSWPLSPASPGGSSSSGGGTASADAPRLRIRRGLQFPFRRDGISDFASATGKAYTRSKVMQVLGTRASSASSQGELPWRANFGSLLHQIRYRNNDAVTEALGRQRAMDAFAQWLPNLRVTDVKLRKEQDDTGAFSVLVLDIFYEELEPGGKVVGQDQVSVGLSSSGG